MTWTEPEYLAHLEAERRRYAWVLRRYGGLGPQEAEAAAVEWYAYEQADAPFRGLVFHDDAWHWAMIAIHGQSYVVERPELVQAPAEFEALG